MGPVPGVLQRLQEDDLATAKRLIVPRRSLRVALIMDNCGAVCLANQGYLHAYFDNMRLAGFTSENQTDNGQDGWDGCRRQVRRGRIAVPLPPPAG